ncbi:hypothetical protein XENOCAPTIV_014176 [Xenoophorus captivus]|uniref:Uncharacterized protein n=1 Tax=Xenoophorus captivus TaxID=1517983 RepID=A0ABV0S4J0_9TELE
MPRYSQVVYCMDRALALAPVCHRFKINKAECLALLGRYPEAQSVARYAAALVVSQVAALNDLLVYTLSCCTFRSQTSAEDGTDGAEEEQKERLLQGAGSRQERHRGRDKKGVPQAGPHAPPGYLSGSCCTPITSL